MSDGDDRIRERAHEIWEEEGRPDGRAEAHWRQAMEEVSVSTKMTRTEGGSDPKVKSGGRGEPTVERVTMEKVTTTVSSTGAAGVLSGTPPTSKPQQKPL